MYVYTIEIYICWAPLRLWNFIRTELTARREGLQYPMRTKPWWDKQRQDYYQWLPSFRGKHKSYITKSQVYFFLSTGCKPRRYKQSITVLTSHTRGTQKAVWGFLCFFLWFSKPNKLESLRTQDTISDCCPLTYGIIPTSGGKRGA